MELKGTYSYYQSGALIAVRENLVTTAGKRHIFRYLAGQVPNLAGAMAFGVSNDPTQLETSSLTFEIGRATLFLLSPDYINNNLIFKTTIDTEVVGNIYEVGLYSTNSNLSIDTRTLLLFQEGVEEFNGGEFSRDNNRVGTSALSVTAEAGSQKTVSSLGLSYDLSTYSDLDEFSLAYFLRDSHVSSVKVRIRTTSHDYYEYTAGTGVVGYQVSKFKKGSASVVGVPSWTNINDITLFVTAKASGATTVDYDGLRIESLPLGISENVLISRAVNNEPVVKTGDRELDIEYKLNVVGLG